MSINFTGASIKLTMMNFNTTVLFYMVPTGFSESVSSTAKKFSSCVLSCLLKGTFVVMF